MRKGRCIFEKALEVGPSSPSSRVEVAEVGSRSGEHSLKDLSRRLPPCVDRGEVAEVLKNAVMWFPRWAFLRLGNLESAQVLIIGF